MNDVKLTLVESAEDCWALLRWLGERRPEQVLGLDTETGGLEYFRDGLRTVQFGDAQHGWTVDAQEWKGIIRTVLDRWDGRWVLLNANFDIHFLEHAGLKVDRNKVEDVRPIAHALDPASPTGLKPLARRYLDVSADAGEKALNAVKLKNGWDWKTIPVNVPEYWAYAALDTVLTARLWEKLSPQVLGTSLRPVYDLELAVLHVVGEAEARGFKVDLARCRETRYQYEHRAEQIRAEALERWGVRHPTNNREVIATLMRDGVDWTKMTPSGNQKSLDEEVLESLDHPLARLVLELRSLDKLRVTYLERVEELAHDGVIHCNMNTLGARTGRMSVTRPPLQTLPRGWEIRDVFTAREGNTLLLCDMDQIEMRIMAHFANEEAMLQAIRDGVDMHDFITEKIYHTKEFTKAQRDIAKGGSFAKIYGAGTPKFAKSVKISIEEGRAFMAVYDTMFPGVRRLQEQVINTIRGRTTGDTLGWVQTPLGRRHPVELDKAYAATNYLCQGTAADIFKRMVVELANVGLDEYLVLLVHDEVVLDVPDDLVDEAQHVALKVMEDRTSLRCPLTAGAKQVKRWGDAYR